jgi:hypothetical protein
MCIASVISTGILLRQVPNTSLQTPDIRFYLPVLGQEGGKWLKTHKVTTVSA